MFYFFSAKNKNISFSFFRNLDWEVNFLGFSSVIKMTTTPTEQLQELQDSLGDHRWGAADHLTNYRRSSSSPIQAEKSEFRLEDEEKEKRAISAITPRLFYLLTTGRTDFVEPSATESEGDDDDYGTESPGADSMTGVITPPRTPPGFNTLPGNATTEGITNLNFWL